MANILERTRAAWSIFLQRGQPTATPPGPVDANSPAQQMASLVKGWANLFAVDYGREQRFDDFDQMDTSDIAIQLDSTVDASLMFEEEESSDDILLCPESFKIAFTGAKQGRAAYGTSQARRVFEQMLEDTAIRQELPAVCRDMLKYGDAYLEMVRDDNDENTIVRVIHKPSRQMRVNRDTKGRLIEGEDENGRPLAYQQVDKSGRVIAGWYPQGEIIHFKLFRDSAYTYSTKSMLDDIREEWRKLTWIEQGMIIARVVRAYPRLLHTLDMTGKSVAEATNLVEQYVRSITSKQQMIGYSRKAPMSVDEDYFLTTGYVTEPQSGKMQPKLNKIELLDPNNTSLGEIGDVSYQRRKTTSRVPGEIIGISDANGKDLTSQDIAYGRFVRRVQFRLEEGLREFFNTGLKTSQIDGVKFRIIWPTVVIGTTWKFADARFRSSMADRNDLEMGVTSPQAIMRDRGLSDDEITKRLEEWDAYQELLVKYAKAAAPTPPANTKPAATPKKAGGADRTAGRTVNTSGTGQAAQGAKSGG
jgi:YD repeat-containing protein